uniref:Sushi domain-containing protein n=1 Tax=Macrostomum lignano TaxID=282301 RepID=A0A1I8J1S8_9PLAT
MKLLACVLLVASVIESLIAATSGLCRLQVTRKAIASSWQSSHYTSSYTSTSRCFYTRSEIRTGQWDFIHSGDRNSSAVDGYHWFVLLLNQSERIRSVTVESRDVPGYSVEFRAADVELFASQSDLSSQLGSEHCGSRQISSVFNSKPSAWSYCGKTKSKIDKGEHLTVKCDRTVRMLLLRKFVANLTNSYHQCMNFVNMWLNRIDFEGPQSRYKISTELGICNAATPRADVKVTFESPDASKHLCRAFDSKGQQLTIRAVKNPTCDVADNLLRSQWLCSNCSSSANVSVICDANRHQAKTTIGTECPKNKPWPLVIVLTVVFILLILASALFVFARKKFCSQPQSNKDEPPAVSSHPMAALNCDAPQQKAVAATTTDVTQPSISVLEAEVNEDSNSSELFRITSECCYDTVNPDEQMMELSQSSRVNSDATEYLEIISDGIEQQSE